MSSPAPPPQPTTPPLPADSLTPAQPSNPAPEWSRPPDFDARLARVTASLPHDPATFSALSPAEQTAFYEASLAAVRREFPDMPVGAEGQFAIGGQQAKADDLPVQPEDPAPKWVRPPDFDARMARVTASIPYDAASFGTLSRAEQIAFYEATMDAVRKEFPDMPFGVGQGGKEWEGKNWAEVAVDFGRVIKTLDEETGKKLNVITTRMYEEVFEEGVVKEVRGEVRDLLGESYPEVWKAVDEALFEKMEGLEKMREHIKKEIEAGRGNPFLKCAGGACAVPGKAEVKEGE
ncbi:hypothetical protein B0T18DRAFT_239607 [Schizothecium vesticola]|uniref:Uncharacterized protein n=1 Tax=Schizothecium vesticola TaxID=314040 RepID=A0AA40BPP9_9PEZI|nr:hypothetical protein B0T18DRAFT_239607 [Schizothecium vesticola]